jgi:glycosyltransferase involved in cell wall biosynthesis
VRILHIIGTLDPQSGGPAAVIAALTRFSAPETRNEAVTLDNPAAPFLLETSLAITALGPTRTRYGFNPRLVSWLRANADRFDGIVVHGLWQYCGLAAWRVFSGRKPYMVFPHGMLDPYFKHVFPLKHIKKWIYWAIIEYWILRGAYRVLFTCEEEQRLAAQSFWLQRWNGHILPLGAALPEGDQDAFRLAFLARFPTLTGRRYLLFLGRIDRKKGCDLLIAAFIRAAALDPDLNLVMAGPDERNWRADLEPAIHRADLASRVHWTGMLVGNEKWGAFTCCEAFILPSHQENFGIAVAEALASSRPVLVSDKVNIAASIAAAAAGLIDSDTEDGTLRLISAWIAMPAQQRQTMANAARLLFEHRYDMRNHARQIGNLFHDAAQSHLPHLTTPASAVK